MANRHSDPINYSINNDYSGTRAMQSIQEFVQYHGEDGIRIWYNDISDGYDAHWHTALEIIVPVDNRYDAVIDNTSYSILPGEVLIIPPGCMHSLKAPDQGARFIFLFDISAIARLHGFSQIQAILTPPQVISKASHPRIYEDIYGILMKIRDIYFGEREFYELSVYALLLDLFVIIGNDHLNSINFFSSMRPSKQKEYASKFSAVMEYIDAHYMSDLSLDEVAATAGFSKFHFSRMFKQYTGFTFCDYIRHRKIQTAEELLNQSDLSVTEIAMQSGFMSLSTFNRVFRQLKNCSPSEFREKNQILFPHS